MSSKGIRLTVGEKIMLLLLHYSRYRGEFQAPMDITQDGIAGKLGIIRSAVPRAVGSLIDKQILEESLAHIKGLTRRRKVYHLTDEGIMKARSLVDQLERIEIEIIDQEGKRKANLGTLLSDNEMDLAIISELLNTKVWDRTKMREEREGKHDRKRYVHSLTPPDIFIGREREVNFLKEAIISKKKRVSVVYGIAGVGKTTLSWKITEIFKNDMNIFYIDLKEWTSLGYMLKELGTFLSGCGWDHLKNLMDPNTEIEIEPICDLIKTLPEDLPILLVLDDVHRAPEEVLMFLASLKERLHSMKNMNIIILSRYRVNFYDIRDVRITGLIGEEELLGFDRETSRRFLIERGFPKGEVDQIIEKTGGHPLALVLVEKEGFGIETTDFEQFLSIEIFSKLSRPQTYTLGLLSLYRLQLGYDDLLGIEDIEADVISTLVDQHLIFDTPGGFVIHDLIKEQAVEHMLPHDRKKAHEALMDILRERLISAGFFQDVHFDVPPTPFALEVEEGLGAISIWVSELAHHEIGAERQDDALRTVIRAQFQIPSKDLLQEMGERALMGLSPDIDTQKLKGLLAGSLECLKGDHEASLEHFRSTASGRSKEDLTSSSIRAARLWIPFLEEKVDGPGKALETIEALPEKEIPPNLRYYFMITRASLYYKLGDHEGASRIYDRFLKDLINNEDLPIHLRKSIDDTVNKALEGGIQEALERFQKLMELIGPNISILKEGMPFIDVDHHLLSAIYSSYYKNQ